MKAMLCAIAVSAAIIGLFAYIVHSDPNRMQTQEALAVLHEKPGGMPDLPTALGYVDLKKYSIGTSSTSSLNREYSVDFALAAIGDAAAMDVVRGTLLRQDYQLRQAEYQLAQLKHLGGDITSDNLEMARAAYAAATKRLQDFLDSKYRTP